MRITGGCLCGHITYRAQINEHCVIICHCHSCQQNAGTAFGVVAPVIDDDFTLLTGELASFESVADSGRLRARTFCAKCGTRIYAKTVNNGPGIWAIRAGTIDQRAELSPVAQMWCQSALPWALIDDLPQIPGQPTAADIDKLLASRDA